MLALGPRSRAALGAVAFIAFAGAFVATPLAARSSAGEQPADGPATSPIPEPPSVAVIVPRRDPFAGGVPAVPAAAAAPIASGALGAVPPIPAALGVLPPNAGASGIALPFGSPARVTAIVTGPHPFALVDEGGTTRVVGTGERIGAATIAAIGPDGVRLTNGTTLHVGPAGSTAARPPGDR
jgi:hypothetical protein